jgi:hypothetical protein
LQVLGLIQHHPKKKRRNLETDTHRENKSRWGSRQKSMIVLRAKDYQKTHLTPGEGSGSDSSSQPSAGTRPGTPWSWTSVLQKCKTVHVCV